MTLQIIDGRLRSTAIPLKKDFIFASAFFKDLEMQKEHAQITVDHNFNWKINSLGTSKIRLGSDEVDSISLIPGLIFHLGQTGFKVIERAHPKINEWEQISAEFIDKLDLQTTPKSGLFFFLFPVQLHFIQGPQAGTIYTLSYGPRVLGLNQLDLDLKDPAQPHELLKFLQVGDKTIVENLSTENAILVNNTNFTQHTLSHGDRLTFGSNIVEVALLK